MNSQHENPVSTVDRSPDESSECSATTRFNALDILARFPSLTEDEHMPCSRQARGPKRSPRERSLRILGGIVLGVFVLAIAIPYFWGDKDSEAVLPETAKTSFDTSPANTDSVDSSAAPEVRAVSGTPAEDSTRDSEEEPLEASEFERALGIVQSEPVDQIPSPSVQPFVVDGAAEEASTAGEGNSLPSRPLAPRFEDARNPLVSSGNASPWPPRHTSGDNPDQLPANSRDEAPSSGFTPWQPPTQASPESLSQAPNSPRGEENRQSTYSPWPDSRSVTPSPSVPPEHAPAHTAMNPYSAPVRHDVAPGAGPSRENPPAVWSPGNPYAVPYPTRREGSSAPAPYHY